MPRIAYTNLSEKGVGFVKKSAPPGSTFIVEQDDTGRWTVIVDSPDNAAAPVSADAHRPAPAMADHTDSGLGSLSARYESNGDPAAIGFDANGGWSYGLYQIATRTDTMSDFLAFLNTRMPRAHDALVAAGDAGGAAEGSTAFKEAWRNLCADEAFAESQHAFVKSTHYDPLAESLRRKLALDVERRSRQLQDVVWSVSVQHGAAGGCRIFEKALANRTVADLDDKDIINLLYDERSNVDEYFSASSPAIKQAVLNRFERERTQALA